MNPFEAPATFFALFSAVMVFIMATLTWLLKSTRADQDKITTTLDNHLGSIAKSLTLVEERLSAADRRTVDAGKDMASALPVFYRMQSDIELIKSALVQSTIVPPGTRATVEPMMQSLDEQLKVDEERRAAEQERQLQRAERERVKAIDEKRGNSGG